MPLPASIHIKQGSSDQGALIEAALLQSLRTSLPQAQNASMVLTATDGAHNQVLVGGLTASTSYGWLLIKTLWVDAAYRQQGIAIALLSSAQAQALALGCHSAWLDTSNPQAQQFYRRRGYNVFAELANTPEQSPGTHRRWFMKKPLKP